MTTEPAAPRGVDLTREGSAYDAARERRASAKWTRRVKQRLSWHLVGLVAAIFPWLYRTYCRFVWATSRGCALSMGAPSSRLECAVTAGFTRVENRL